MTRPVTRPVFLSTNNTSSLLKGIGLTRPFDLAKVNAIAFLKKAREKRKLMDNQENKEEEMVYVTFDHEVWAHDDVMETLRTNSAFKQNEDTSWRTKTKHRIVTSKVTGYMVTDVALVKDEKPYTFFVTTTCAPNAMGSSEEDMKEFFSDEPLDLSHYKSTMKLIYKRCIEDQARAGGNVGVTVLIIPPVGLGVYLRKLRKDQKKAVIAANYEALSECINEITNPKRLKEIVCVMPDKNGKNDYWESAEKKLILNHRNAAVAVTIARADFLVTAKKLWEQNHLVGLINPGSDRTIGGSYENFINDASKKELPPAEETLCLATDLADIQAINTKRKKRFTRYVWNDELRAKPKKVVKRSIPQTTARPDGILSDHARQDIQLTCTPATGAPFTLSGSTWNCMNQCFPIKNNRPNSYTNNPWNAKETNEQYRKRIEDIILEIENVISNGPTDFMFLQEVDFLFTNAEGLKNKFLEMLDRCGWKGVSSLNTPDKTQKRLVTIYNPNRLTPKDHGKSVLAAANGKLCGYETTFEVTSSGKNVTLVNLHLEYDEKRGAYTDIINNYVTNIFNNNDVTTAQSSFLIMGGDTNRPLGFDSNLDSNKISLGSGMSSLMNETKKIVTNIASDLRPINPINHITRNHGNKGERGKKNAKSKIRKHYDFFTLHAAKGNQIRWEKIGGERFKKSGKVFSLEPYEKFRKANDSNAKHTTRSRSASNSSRTFSSSSTSNSSGTPSSSSTSTTNVQQRNPSPIKYHAATNITTINNQLRNSGYKVATNTERDNDGAEYRSVKNSADQTKQFRLYEAHISTREQNDVNTFIAILKTHIALHGQTDVPIINTHFSLKRLWLNACASVYGRDNLAQKIDLRVTGTPPRTTRTPLGPGFFSSTPQRQTTSSTRDLTRRRKTI